MLLKFVDRVDRVVGVGVGVGVGAVFVVVLDAVVVDDVVDDVDDVVDVAVPSSGRSNLDVLRCSMSYATPAALVQAFGRLSEVNGNKVNGSISLPSEMALVNSPR